MIRGSAASGLVLALLISNAAVADDTELLLLNPDPAQPVTPNILFILDTSASMASLEESVLPYDDNQGYAGNCQSDRLYWTDVDFIPDCSTDNFSIRTSAFQCEAAARQLSLLGSFTNTLIQYRDGGSDGRGAGPETWQSLAAGYSDAPVECLADSGVHGDGRRAYKWARKGSNLDDPFTRSSAKEVSWGSAPRHLNYTVYSGNYLNWRQNPIKARLSRADIVQQVLRQILGAYEHLNVGLMRFNQEDGGVVAVAVKDLERHRDEVLERIESFDPATYTPLAESLFEAALYWRGLPAHYGESPGAFAADEAAFASTDPAVYRSPAIHACARNYNILLSDGEAKRDEDVALLLGRLPNFPLEACTVSGEGACLEDLAQYLATVDINPAEPEDQLVTTHTIGFTVDLPRLAATAAASGGAYFQADDVESLTRSLTTIIANISKRSLSFTAPAVAANSFNRTRNLNDLYVGQFAVQAKARWPGNLKKYRISQHGILDARGAPAIDPMTGFFKDSVSSFWSDQNDGNDVHKGGAANKLPVPGSRKLYTNKLGADLTSPANALDLGNLDAFSDADLGLSGSQGEPTKDELIRWARGEDVLDLKPGTTVRNEMGDPLHAQPAAVVYGGPESSPEVVVFMATNDGYLHAIDGASGVELWSFVPEDLLPNLTRLFVNPNSRYKHYGLDGAIVPAVKDVNGNGSIEPLDGDFVYIVFGMRRGGSTLYALDVTDKHRPRMLWQNASAQFGETWSAPVIARMDIASMTQNSDKAVVVVGGGYDTIHDTSAHPQVVDGRGAGIHIIDLESGLELWRTGRDDGADLKLSTMTRSIPTAVRVIDLSGDGYADRMYASDMGGRIWRFDVLNGQPPSSLVAGGVIAKLGAEGNPNVSPATTRRFYSAPDVSIFLDKKQQRRFIALSIGSGYRSHPFDLSARDQFYSIRDADVFTRLPQSAYSTYEPVKVSDLVEVSGKTGVIVSASQRGWKFTLPDNQKVLSDSLTFDDQVLFVAFSPDRNAAVNCGTGQGSNYLYRMAIANGDPVAPDPAALDATFADEARHRELRQTGIAPAPVLLFPPPDDLGCGTGLDCTPPPLLCVGMECSRAGFENHPVRTLWTQEGIE